MAWLVRFRHGAARQAWLGTARHGMVCRGMAGMAGYVGTSFLLDENRAARYLSKMGGPGSGTPPAREIVEAALRAVELGLSLRKAAKRFGVCRDTLAHYRDNPHLFRRKVRRCPDCGNVVLHPCLRCSIDVKVAVLRRDKSRLAKARRRVSGGRLRPGSPA